MSQNIRLSFLLSITIKQIFTINDDKQENQICDHKNLCWRSIQIRNSLKLTQIPLNKMVQFPYTEGLSHPIDG